MYHHIVFPWILHRITVSKVLCDFHSKIVSVNPELYVWSCYTYIYIYSASSVHSNAAGSGGALVHSATVTTTVVHVQLQRCCYCGGGVLRSISAHHCPAHIYIYALMTPRSSWDFGDKSHKSAVRNLFDVLLRVIIVNVDCHPEGSFSTKWFCCKRNFVQSISHKFWVFAQYFYNINQFNLP